MFFFKYILILCCLPLLAQIPNGYYDQVDFSSQASFRQTLHETIDDHVRFPYTDSTTDTWDILEKADKNLYEEGFIVDLYKNESFPVQGGGNDFYDREHTWPKSYGFPDDGDDNYPFTDCHHLFLCDIDYNSYRSNKPFRNCSAACTEFPTEATNGSGGGAGVYPSNSNWTSGDYTDGTWETWDGRKGDIARAMFYMAIRYEGGTHGITGSPEPDLELTDDEDLISTYQTGDNEPLAYMGMLSTLLKWNHLDPPDIRERNRNEAIYSYQGNRNPFIDHPEWADLIFDHLIHAAFAYSIPHLAGSAWDSRVVVYNPTSQPISFYLNKWDEAGNLVIFNDENTVAAYGSIQFDSELLGFNGMANVVSGDPDLMVKVAFRFGETESLTEFFVERNQTDKTWMIPNTQTPWFDWFGVALGNFQTTEVSVMFEAFKGGQKIASSQKILLPFQKWVGISSSIWEGVTYSGVDMVLIHSEQPIPAPISITGTDEQDRHVFFLGQVLDP